MKAPPAPVAFRSRRFEGNQKDPYAIRGKPAGPAVCPDCRAVFEGGRWRWRAATPPRAVLRYCQACLRIRDSYPAGRVLLTGPYVGAHRAEVVGAAQNAQRRETSEHPLNRIMSIANAGEGVVITTTDVHLPRLIGETLRRAHGGALQVRYDDHGYAVKVEWRSP